MKHNTRACSGHERGAGPPAVRCRRRHCRCPRSVGLRAEAYLKTTGIADIFYAGPEQEFFIFDSVRYSRNINGCSYLIDSIEGAWNSDKLCISGLSQHSLEP